MIKLLATVALATSLNVIPAPVSTEVGDGVYKMTGKKNEIVMRVNRKMDLPSKEGYVLTVDRKGIKATAPSEAGLFYARQTLNQLIRPDGTVPFVKITDYPRFSWRGIHIDPCRHFLSVEEVKKEIDILSQYKINTMHWHLTDDQGWRIEIKKYPRLTEVGAWRSEFEGGTHGGFYTQDEIREVVAYAAERFVTIVPEIEMPGHAMAAIRSYPELSCTMEPVGNFANWGTSDLVYCPGKETMFEFMDDVIAEVAALFPSEYIHIGGDECPKTRWAKCPDCQARIRAEGLVKDDKFTAEEKLQSYAVRRAEKILEKYGRKLIGWDEILEGGLSPNATVMSWRGEKGGIAAALEGHDVVMTPGSEGMYFDHYQGDTRVEPVTIGHLTTLEKVYSYDPVPAALKENGKAHHVKGVQANLWSEYIYSDAKRDYMLFPRAFALAEIAWSPVEVRDFADFCARVDVACQKLDKRGVTYHIPIPEQPFSSLDRVVFTDRAEVSFKTTRPMKMVYTLDGSEPTPASAEYTRPFIFTENALIKIASVTSYGKLSPVRTVRVVKEDWMPAAKVDRETLYPGLRTRTAWGRFVLPSDVPSDAAWEYGMVKGLKELAQLEAYDRSMQHTRFYAVEAWGYVDVPKDAVYVLTSVCDQVWIDGRLVIDNGADVKKYSLHDNSIALKAGLHELKVVFLSNVLGGWYASRGHSDLQYRRLDEEEFHTFRENRVFYK